MDTDPYISEWILEFLLLRPLGLDEETLHSLLRTMPLPENPNSNLRKLLLFKKLDLQICNGSISESSLEILENLKDLEFQRGGQVSDAMKRAYCAVAVACTVSDLALDGELDDDVKFRFFKKVRELWKGKIGEMERVLGCRGLGSEELYGWKDDFEAAVWDDGVYERVVRVGKGVNAAEAVGVYVREERERMRPGAFLNVVVERIKGTEGNGEIMGMLGVEGSGDGVTRNEANSCRLDSDAQSDGSGDHGVHKEIVLFENKFTSPERSRDLSPGISTRMEFVDPDVEQVSPSHRNYNAISSAEVNRVQEALNSSLMELQAVVVDPLPDALKQAESICRKRKNRGHEPINKNHTDRGVFIVDGTGVIQDTRCDVSSDLPQSSLMDRNSSAHTYEWDESDTSDGDLPKRRLRLPTPRALNVSPLVIYKPKNVKARRKRKLWSTLEEDTLINGVQIHGIGNWKAILLAYRDIFEERTEVDLKDKWRNLARR